MKRVPWLLVAIGCGRTMTDAGDAAPGSADALTSQETSGLGPVRKLDLLVVIDDSAGVHGEGQQETARALSTLLDELGRGPQGLPDVHLGIVSQDLGAGPATVGNCMPGGRRGALLGAERCGITGGAKFLVIEEGGRRTNASRPLDETLACLTNIGLGACGYEHFLAAALRALSGTVSDNAGFGRPDADLALFIHADEDDCSAPPDSDLFSAEMPGTSSSLRCALLGHRCHGQAIPAAPFEAPFTACDDEPGGGGRLIPVDQFVSAARALRPGRALFVGGVVGRPIPGDDKTYRVERVGASQSLWLSNICGDTNFPDWVGSAAPALRLQRFITALDGTTGSLCHGPSYHTVARALAARINRGR